MKRYRKLFIAFSVFTGAYFAELAINVACGPEPDPYDYYISYFHNNTAGDGYAPFAFTELTFLYDENEPESEARINSREWAAYLGKGVSPEDVYEIMYRTDAATDSLIKRFLDKDLSSLPDSLSRNTYLVALANHARARDYFNFAKAVEPFAVNVYNYYAAWDPEPVDTESMAALAARALEQREAVKRDKFLALRYAYQAARMYHYSHDYEKCVSVCNMYIASAKSKSAIKGWAMALQAGAMRRLGEPALAAYLFSKVFADNPERRIQAYKNFHYIDVDVQEVLTHTRSKEEEAVVWAIDGFRHPDFDGNTLEKVYALAPRSAMVGSLLVREINKLESRLNEAPFDSGGGYWGYYGNADSLKQLAVSHARNLSEFALRLADEKRYPEPDLGTVAAAYLAWMLDEGARTNKLLAGLNFDRLPERLADQARIIDMLVQAKAIRSGAEISEADMIPMLQWLDAKRTDETNAIKERIAWPYYYAYGERDGRFTRTARNLYQSVLAPHYMQLGDTAMATLMMTKGGYWPSEENGGTLFNNISYSTLLFWQQQLKPGALTQLGEWKANGSDRPLVVYNLEILQTLDPDDYVELLGTANLRMHDYGAAVKAFEQLSARYRAPERVDWYRLDEPDTIYADPFISPIKDYPKAYGTVGFNKKQFADRMLDLQQRAEKDTANAAQYYFDMASGAYQTGTFGNAWHLVSYQWSSSDNFLKGKYYYEGDYLHARKAAEWYEKARSLSTDVEFKARCTFMLAKCEQKQFGYASMSEYYENSWNSTVDAFWLFSMRNSYFRELDSHYKHTAFFKQAVGECSYLVDFLKRQAD